MGKPKRDDLPLAKGQVFNPYKVFVGLFIPQCLAEYPGLTASEKLAWGSLAQYAGRDGRCFPSQIALAKRINVTDRQARRILIKLEQEGFIRKVAAPKGSKRRSCRYHFLWHECFNNGPWREKPDTDVRHQEDAHVPMNRTPMSYEEEQQKGANEKGTTNGGQSVNPDGGGAVQGEEVGSGCVSSQDGLSEEVEKFIERDLREGIESGRIRNPQAYKNSMRAKARRGELDICRIEKRRDEYCQSQIEKEYEIENRDARRAEIEDFEKDVTWMENHIESGALSNDELKSIVQSRRKYMHMNEERLRAVALRVLGWNCMIS